MIVHELLRITLLINNNYVELYNEDVHELLRITLLINHKAIINSLV